MKRILRIAALAVIIAMGSFLPSESSAQYRNDISYQTFYDELSPYGRWIDYPGYGYVWSPERIDDFRPYSSNGNWVYTDDYEWTWVSDYDWGWAPFHYGRWFDDPRYGWLWVPGYEWSPAWVSWRDGGDYYGWAPLRPGININVNFGNYSPPDFYWSFVPRRYITYRNVYNHCIDYRRNATIIHQTTIINNYNYDRNVFRTGPRRFDVERYTGRINPVRFRETDRPGRTSFRDNEVNIFRPSVRQDNNSFTPRKFDRAEANDGVRDTKPRTFEPRNNNPRTDVPVRDQNPKPRKFEPRNDNPGTDVPVRDQNPKPRTFEPRNNNPRTDVPVRDQNPKPRTFEPRNNNPRTDVPVRDQNPKPRTFEPRDNSIRPNVPVRDQGPKPGTFEPRNNNTRTDVPVRDQSSKPRAFERGKN